MRNCMLIGFKRLFLMNYPANPKTTCTGMQTTKPLLLFCLIATQLSAISQDKIYFSADTKNGKTASLSLTTLVYTPTGKKSAVTTSTKKLVLLFNSQGNFLYFEKLDFSNPQGQERLRQFLTDTATGLNKDQVYTLSGKRLDDKIITEDKKYLYLQANAEIDKKTVAAVIYKDGRHALYVPADKAAPILWDNKDTSPGIAATQQRDTPPQMKPANMAATPTSTTTSPVTPAKVDTVTVAAGSPRPTTKQAAAPQPAASHTTTFEEVAGQITKDEFERKALQKTNQLNIYLKIICDKSAKMDEVSKAIDQSLTLFVDGNAMVETSSVNRTDVKRYKIGSYLAKIKALNYDKVEIEWTNVQYVSDLKQGPDGNYYGVVSFEQVFRGYRDGKLVYQDITRKNATVVLKAYEKNVDGNTKSLWDVLLSDIGVISTTPA